LYGVDAVLVEAATSSRRVEKLSSIEVCGSTVTLSMQSSKRHCASRGLDVTTLETAIENATKTKSRLLAYYRRELQSRARRLFHGRSYMCGVTEAAAQRSDADGLYLLKNVVAKTVSASGDDFGLGKKAFDWLSTKSLAPTDLRCGFQFPARLLRGGLVRVRTGADLRKLVHCVHVAGDVGVVALCTYVLIKLVPPSDDREWTAIMSGQADSKSLDAAAVARLLESCTCTFMTHEVRGSKRGRSELDAPSAAGKTAAERLAESAQATGGRRALTLDDALRHIAAYQRTYDSLYADSMQRALEGSRRQKLVGRYQRRARDVNSLADAIRVFRAYLLTTNDVLQSEKRQLEDDIMLSVAAFDMRAIVFLGESL
jgi:hypothetical protein